MEKSDLDEICCEICSKHIGWASGDLNCLNLHCDKCYEDLQVDNE